MLKRVPVKEYADNLSDVSGKSRLNSAAKNLIAPIITSRNGENSRQSVDDSLNRDSVDDLNSSMQSRGSSAVSVRDLSYQKISEQHRLLNLVRASPQKEDIRKKLSPKKTPASTSTASTTDKGKDSRVHYKNYWKEG